jgi:hypothetical protein
VLSPLAEILAALRDVFAALGARWYLFGAQAAILHGAARLSADVDVTVHTGGVSVRTLLDALVARGFEARVDSIAATCFRSSRRCWRAWAAEPVRA